MATNNEMDNAIRAMEAIKKWVNDTDKLLIRNGLKPHPSADNTEPTVPAAFSKDIASAQLDQFEKQLNTFVKTLSSLETQVSEISAKQKKLDNVSEVVNNIKTENDTLRKEVEKLSSPTPARRKKKETTNEQE